MGAIFARRRDLPFGLVKVLEVPEEALALLRVHVVVFPKNFGHGSAKPLFTALHVSVGNIDAREHDR